MMGYKIILSDDEWAYCYEFAAKQLPTSIDTYKKRGQVYIPKLIEDIAFGKVCELAVYKKFNGVEYPDFLVYNKTKKRGFDADLKAGKKLIHVKSCREGLFNDGISTSWVFQPDDPLVVSPKDEDYLALCVVYKDLSIEFDIVKASKVKDLYRGLIIRSLNKKCLYLSDIQNFLKT